MRPLAYLAIALALMGMGDIHPAPLAIVTSAKIAFSPATIAPGSSATLIWSSTNASSCAISSSGQTRTVPTSGSVSTGPVQKTTVAAIACNGATASATLTVTAPPPILPKCDPLKPYMVTRAATWGLIIQACDSKK